MSRNRRNRALDTVPPLEDRSDRVVVLGGALYFIGMLTALLGTAAVYFWLNFEWWLLFMTVAVLLGALRAASVIGDRLLEIAA